MSIMFNMITLIRGMHAICIKYMKPMPCNGGKMLSWSLEVISVVRNTKRNLVIVKNSKKINIIDVSRFCKSCTK